MKWDIIETEKEIETKVNKSLLCGSGKVAITNVEEVFKDENGKYFQSAQMDKVDYIVNVKQRDSKNSFGTVEIEMKSMQPEMQKRLSRLTAYCEKLEYGRQKTNSKINFKNEFGKLNVKIINLDEEMIVSDKSFLVLADTEDNEWKDEVGVKYHYENNYSKKIVEGMLAIWCRKKGTKSSAYCGIGIISDIEEPTPGKYVAYLNDFEVFKNEVELKNGNGQYYEPVEDNSYFQSGNSVRKIAIQYLKPILDAANCAYTYDEVNEATEISELILTRNDNILSHHEKKKMTGENRTKFYGRATSKATGDKGEKLVYSYLQNSLNEKEAQTLEHLSINGKTPGYDISYNDLSGNAIGIEVKSTTANKFTHIIFTDNEKEAMRKLKNNYYLYLVADCNSSEPMYTIIQNPLEYFAINKVEVENLSYFVRF